MSHSPMHQRGQSRSRGFALLFCFALLAFWNPAFAAADETLGPGDSIRITVFENPNLTTETRISARGTIDFPLIGNIKIGGFSPSGAVDRISEALKDGNFIRNPQVSLSVTQVRSRQVSVLGQVSHPGRYPLDETVTNVTDILALAGGITANGDDVVTVIRTRNGKTEKHEIDIQQMARNGDLSGNLQIEHGDTIFVRRVPVFYILGAVQRAGTYRLENNMNVIQAIAASGGMTVYGTDRGIKISRRTADGGLSKHEAQLADQVKADDTIYIQESFF